ncbi:hypothetical protein LCGC14_0536870 [marine sediment metagenome]|uniref:DNA methylase N-4/N-6 domain-containing protein n=1 Tax=marine sediment metagenome TaxID=412755 RepID=A0A0F9SCC8_9ZZZZ
MKAGIYNRDCIESMQEFPDNFFELAIVDPPYGIGSIKHYNTKFKNESKKWNKKIPSYKYFADLFRISKKQIIWGGNYFTNYLPAVKSWVIWDKDFNGHTNGFSDAELAWISDNSRTRIFKFKANDGKQNAIKKIHPTQKPIELYEWLLMNYAKKGDKILDTHLGSGSSAIAAHRLGYEFWGFEIDKDYYEAAVKRINLEKIKLRLF